MSVKSEYNTNMVVCDVHLAFLELELHFVLKSECGAWCILSLLPNTHGGKPFGRDNGVLSSTINVAFLGRPPCLPPLGLWVIIVVVVCYATTVIVIKYTYGAKTTCHLQRNNIVRIRWNAHHCNNGITPHISIRFN